MHTEILQEATPLRLQQAAAFNHRELFGVESISLGGAVYTSGGLVWTLAGKRAGSMVSFPELTAENADEHLDRLIASYLHQPPRDAGCWSLDPPQPEDLGVRLLARGFHPGWRPYWMALDLQQLSAGAGLPNGLNIRSDNQFPLHDIKDLPYAQVVIPQFPSTDDNGRWARFVAFLHGKPVAHCVVFLTNGPLGAAGIYHVGVVPQARHKGIGQAVTRAACQYARERGYRFAVLNSTDAGRRCYERLGFSRVGEGFTWWLVIDRLLRHPPTPLQIRLAEAIGRGDAAALASLSTECRPATFQMPLTNGMTFMQLAVHFRQPVSGEWLFESGAPFTVLDAWDLGWKDRARQQLYKDPENVNQLYGEMNRTLLHIAAERNDEELCRLALSVRPRLSLKDSVYQSTALGWARFFGHETIIRLLEGRS